MVVAHDATEALHFLRRTGKFADRYTPDPTAIFVDNTLPGFGGADLVAEIRKMPNLKTVPVIVLSGSSDMNVVDRCSKAGANSFLEKPVDMTEYMKYVSTATNYWLNLNLLPPRIGSRSAPSASH